jgi:ABC-type cobalamin/Fe3+-siderophores transport system ATPase subunit
MNYIGTDPTSGKILQVVAINYQGAYTTTAASWEDVSGLSIAITPSSTNSKISVVAVLQMGSSDWFGVNIVREVSGASDVILNQGTDTVGSRQNSTYGSSSNQLLPMMVQSTRTQKLVYLDSPATILEVTYQVQIVARWGTTAQSVYINRPGTWNDDSISGRVTASNIIVSEIKV